MNREEIIRILANARQELREAYAVKSLALFGSAARNEARPESDIDFLVEFSQPVGLFQFIGLKQYLESLLGRPVDLGTVASLKPRLKETVLREMVYVA